MGVTDRFGSSFETEDVSPSYLVRGAKNDTMASILTTVGDTDHCADGHISRIVCLAPSTAVYNNLSSLTGQWYGVHN